MSEFGQAMKTAENWFSDPNEPDPEVLPQVCGYNLLVRPLRVKEKVGSIILPDSVRDDAQALTNVARVLAVGPDAYTGDRFSTGPWCKKGDYVVFSKFRGAKILFRNVPLTLIADDEVLMVVNDPLDIQAANFNMTKQSV